MTYDELCSYGSAKVNYYTGNAKTTMTHFIGAESLGEKSAFLPTYEATTANTAVWAPHFLIGVKGPAALGEGQGYAFNYAMEWSFDVTFRGTRHQ